MIEYDDGNHALSDDKLHTSQVPNFGFNSYNLSHDLHPADDWNSIIIGPLSLHLSLKCVDAPACPIKVLHE